MSLSEYERQRLENIKENEALLRTLEIPTTTINKKKSNATSSLRQHRPTVKKERQLPTRASARIRGEEPSEASKRPLDFTDFTVIKKPKTIDALDPEEQAKMIQLMKKTLVPNTEPKVKAVKQEETQDDEPLKHQLDKLEIQHTWTTIKVTPQRISACLFHPSDSKLLACAVDVEGHLGFWDIKQQQQQQEEEEEEEDPIVYTYKPHTRTVTDLHFNPVDHAKLMTSSYDGLIRMFDMNKAAFENVALQENYPLTSFDISQDGHNVYFSTSDGDIGLKDIRSQEKETMHHMREKKIGCIHLNPIHTHLLAAASNDRSVTIWDNRMWSSTNKSPLHEFEHGYSTTSCYWSPQGDMLATTSYDDYIRLFTLNHQDMELKSAIKHNNHTGRWVTNFRARWNYNIHVKQPHFIIGNMNQTLDIYSASTGKEVIRLYDANHITAIPSVNAFHPTIVQPTLLAGNASGRMVCWESSSSSTTKE